jgi:8-oxo-dGTP pyrophosphatase MutT (NUDIX family)
MDFHSFQKLIAKIQQSPLIGDEAHFLMAPIERRVPLNNYQSENYKPKIAAVNILFYPKNNQTHVLFIKRTADQSVHSGQIAFPGGKKDAVDSHEKITALRELHEEVGILNYQIETGGNVKQVMLSGVVGMLFAFFAHILIFGNEAFIRIFWKIYYKSALVFRLINTHEYSSSAFVPNKNIKLNLVFIASFISTIALLFVYILPQIFATLYFDYRLTLSSVGQILSFLGMIVTLFVLDPQLFRMHDAGKIKDGFSYYLNGRLFGLGIAALVLMVSFFIA